MTAPEGHHDEASAKERRVAEQHRVHNELIASGKALDLVEAMKRSYGEPAKVERITGEGGGK